MFQDENTLVSSFLDNIRKYEDLWEIDNISTEFFYQRGRTDIIVLSKQGDVIAFEAKLKKWRIALQQAYRNKSFANMSYVILPKPQALLASNYEEEFLQREVGLCSISENNVIEIIFYSQNTEPLQPWLWEKALNYINEEEYSFAE